MKYENEQKNKVTFINKPNTSKEKKEKKKEKEFTDEAPNTHTHTRTNTCKKKERKAQNSEILTIPAVFLTVENKEWLKEVITYQYIRVYGRVSDLGYFGVEKVDVEATRRSSALVFVKEF